MATQATDRLEVVDFMPAVEKLWNDRYRLTFYCRISDKKEDWFGGNVSTFLPAFGELQGANFTGDGWSPRDGEEYNDMRLVEAGAPYISASGEHLVTLVYETISDTFTQEVDDETNKPKNGLRGVTRKSIAKSGTEYTGEIGVTTIQHQVNQESEITLYLAQVEIEDTDAYRRVTEVWVESGILSETLDNVGSQKAKVIETIGADPATPTGYSLASKQESDFEGFQTNRFTFLKPSILSLQQELVGGATTVQVNAFGLTETQVNALLSEVTASHVLISQSENDYDGIITSQFTYEVDDFEIESQAEDGMEIIIRTELSASNFSSGVIGTSTYKTLFLAQENIDNGNTIKKRTSRYSEAGVLSISPLEEDGFSLAPSYVYVTTGAPASSMTGLVKPNGTLLGDNVTWFEPKVQNVEGFSTYTQQVLAISLTNTVQVHSVDKFFTITEPGVMSTGGAFNSNTKSGAATRYPEATQQPRTYRKKATVNVYLTSSNSITESEVAFTEKDVDWCSIGFDSFYTNDTESTASVSSSWRSFPQYLNSSGTTDTSEATILGVYAAYANSYKAGDTTYTTSGIYRVELEKYTRAVDGTQLYLKTIVIF